MNKIPQKRLDLFFETAWKRHKIYVLKEMGMKKPWTPDLILRSNYFCNVFRKLDKTSVRFIKQVIEPNEHRPDLWKTIMLFRYISRISTYDVLEGHEFDFHWMYYKLRDMQKNKEKIFTNAFIVNSKGIGGGWDDKVSYIFKLLKHIQDSYIQDKTSFDKLLQMIGSIKEAYGCFINLSGIGPFMAYQYCMDFAYSKRYLKNASDTYTWTSLGLGARRGMNRLLFGQAKSNKILFDLRIAANIYEEWRNEIFHNLDKKIDETYALLKMTNHSFKRIEIANLYEPFNHLKMCEVEHWLCEFDKYCRGGSKKRKYDGG